MRADGLHPDGVEIRPCADEDLTALVGLSLRAWEPVFSSVREVLGERTFADVYPDWRAAQADVVERVLAAEDTDALVADVDGVPAGYVVTARRTEDAARVGEVELLAVDPEHQGRGLGGALVEAALEQIRGYGVDLAVVATGGDAGHDAARAVYERAGFRLYPQVRGYRRLDEDDPLDPDETPTASC